MTFAEFGVGQSYFTEQSEKKNFTNGAAPMKKILFFQMTRCK